MPGNRIVVLLDQRIFAPTAKAAEKTGRPVEQAVYLIFRSAMQWLRLDARNSGRGVGQEIADVVRGCPTRPEITKHLIETDSSPDWKQWLDSAKRELIISNESECRDLDNGEIAGRIILGHWISRLTDRASRRHGTDMATFLVEVILKK